MSQTREFAAGFKAALAGKDAASNPYKQRPARGEWLEGFDAGCWEKAARAENTENLKKLTQTQPDQP